MAYNKLSTTEKLLTKAVHNGECLIWTGQKNQKGYGLLKLDGKPQLAHRLIYALHYGPIPSGVVVRHSCDNTSCIAIAHLIGGTQLDNVHDMLSRKRANKAKGEAHPKSKLTDAQVAEIRRRYIPRTYGKGAHCLALEFGVSKQSIQAILRGDTWKHLL